MRKATNRKNANFQKFFRHIRTWGKIISSKQILTKKHQYQILLWKFHFKIVFLGMKLYVFNSKIFKPRGFYQYTILPKTSEKLPNARNVQSFGYIFAYEITGA